MSDVNFKGAMTCAMQVKDLSKAIDWYQDRLGFKELYRLEDAGWAEVNSPCHGVSLGFSVVEQPQVEGGATITFEVADVEGARQSLESKQVKFDGPIHTIEGVVKMTTFFDDDGNKLMFTQSLMEG